MKLELHITFLPDVIIYCAILYNVLLGQLHEEVEELLGVLRREGLNREVIHEEVELAEGAHLYGDDIVNVPRTKVRCDLGLYLSMQRL